MRPSQKEALALVSISSQGLKHTLLQSMSAVLTASVSD